MQLALLSDASIILWKLYEGMNRKCDPTFRSISHCGWCLLPTEKFPATEFSNSSIWLSQLKTLIESRRMPTRHYRIFSWKPSGPKTLSTVFGCKTSLTILGGRYLCVEQRPHSFRAPEKQLLNYCSPKCLGGDCKAKKSAVSLAQDWSTDNEEDVEIVQKLLE